MEGAFRSWYAHLGDIKAVIPPEVPVLCLTATATEKTIRKIQRVLHLKNCNVIQINPDRPEIKFCVKEVQKDPTLTFRWLAQELEEKGQETPKTIIYCRSIRDCGLIYDMFRVALPQSKSYQSSSCQKTACMECTIRQPILKIKEL